MAKKIIILERLSEGDTGFRYALWAIVPATRQSFYANAAFQSQYKSASAAETTALQAGQVAEKVGTIVLSASPAPTLASVQTELVNRFNTFQNNVTNVNQWNQYGAFWDGTGWTAGGVS